MQSRRLWPAMLLTIPLSFTAAGGAETGSRGDRDDISGMEPRPKPLSIWDCETTAGIRGLQRSTDLVKQGEAAVRWRNHPECTGFSVPNVPQDWSPYNQLRLWVHNANRVATRFTILVRSENPATEGMDYWSYGVALDFTGWKELVLPIGGRGGSRVPRGWDQVDGLTFTASGWGSVPDSGADVTIDDIRLEYDPPRPGPRMTDEELFDNLDLSRDDLGAVRTAVEAGDPDGAKAALLDHMRARTRPRWWFDWRDRPAITAGSDTPAVAASADGLLRHVYGGHFLGDDVDWESNKLDPHDPAFTREWTYGLNRFGHWRTLGEAYWATGDEKYAREWIAQMRDWVEDNPWPFYGTGNDSLTWRTIEAGIRASGSWPDSLYY